LHCPDIRFLAVAMRCQEQAKGEPGTSAIVLAVTNAISAATGKRLRKLPVNTTALKQPV